MTTKARIVGLSLGILLMLGALALVIWQGGGLAPGTALAQGAPTATPVPQGATNPAAGTQQQQQRPDLSGYIDAFWTALAKRLGISVDQAKSQVSGAQKDAIESLVTQGKITRDQGNNLEQKIDPNNPVEGFEGRGRFGKFPPGNGQQGQGAQGKGQGWLHGKGFGPGMESTAVLEAVAKALNLEPSDLSSQLQSGKTLADIAAAQKVDQAVVKQAIIDAEKAELQRQVTDGVITQAQSDSIIANLTPDKIDLTRFGLHGGWKH